MYVIDYKKAFFPVDKVPVFYRDTYHFPLEDVWCRGYYAIIDIDKRRTFTTCSESYTLFTNKEAFDLGIKMFANVFHVESEDHILCTGVDLPSTRSACRFYFERIIERFQPLINSGWKPFLTISNTYNKKGRVEVELGFRNNNSHRVVLPSCSVSLSTPHTGDIKDKLEKDLNYALNYGNLSNLEYIEANFMKMIESLKEYRVANVNMLPLFCKVFNVIKPVIKDDKEKEQKAIDRFITKMIFAKKCVDNNSRMYHSTAYSLLFAFSEFASTYKEAFFDAFEHQKTLGKWVEEFIKEIAEEDFSLYDYIGKEAFESVNYFLIRYDAMFRR